MAIPAGSKSCQVATWGDRGGDIRGQEILRGEDHHRAGNRNARRIDGRYPISKEWGRDNLLGWGWLVMITDRNGTEWIR